MPGAGGTGHPRGRGPTVIPAPPRHSRAGRALPADGTSIQRRAERGKTPCPFRSQRKGRVQAKRARGVCPGRGRVGQSAGLPPPAQAGIHTVPLRFSVRGTRSQRKGRVQAKRARRGMPGAATVRGRLPAFHHLRRQQTYRPPSLQRKGDADERSENAGRCPGRRGQAIPPPSFPPHLVIPAQAGIQKGRARANLLPLSLPAKGARASEASTRGMPGAGTGRGRAPSFHHLRRQEPTPSPFAPA